MTSVIVKPDDEGIRPAGPPDACFYCKAKVGDLHSEKCVSVTRKVRVRAVIEYEIDVPSHWGESDINFHRNEGSWCASNMLRELKAIDEVEDGPGCLCPLVEFKYIGESESKP